jgi:predicted patatin/cPLA2 family phospholipase
MGHPLTATRALVVEGGGMRGAFSAGVLDAFVHAGFDPFDLYLGVSAGAANLSSHLAGQRGRNIRVYADIMCRPPLFSWPRFFRGGHFMDLDWFWDTFQREDPLDYEAAVRNLHENQKSFVIVTTSAETGKPVYLEPDLANWSQRLKASCALPLLYRGGVMVDGRLLVDGGVGDPVPVAEAIRRGATHVTVVRSRPSAAVKKADLENRMLRLAFQRMPGLRAGLERLPETYRDSVRLIHRPPRGITMTEFAPAGPLRAGRTTQDREALLADYEQGYALGVVGSTH